MTVSGVKGSNVLFSKAKTTINEKVATKANGEKKVDVKKALAVASAAAAAVGLALIAVNKVKKGQPVDTLSRLKKEGADYVKQVTTQNKAKAALTHVNNQIADVASRTSAEGVTARLDDLKEAFSAFGGVVEHVAQKASIVG